MSPSNVLYPAARSHARAALVIATALGIFYLPPRAQGDQIKANNADNLEAGSSWLSNNAPGAGDIAIFNNTLDGSFSSFTLAADQSWLGIRILNPAAPIAITGVNSLTLGSGGIDLSSSTVPLAISANLFTSADQTWAASSAGSLTISGIITSSNALTFNGGTIALSGGNSLTGTVNVNSGKLLLATAGALGTPTSLSIGAGATLDLGGTNLSIAPPAGTGIIDNSAAGAATLTFASGGTFAGSISNSGGAISLVKAGTGSLVLGTLNTFSGAVTINAGSVAVTNAQSLKNVSSITIAVSGGLRLNDGVVLDRNVISGGDSTGKEVFSNPANSSATLSGNLSAPSRQFRVSTPGSSTLTLLGGISVPTNANAFFTGGNIVLAGSSNLTTGVATLGVGRSSTPTTLLVKDNASVTPANGLILANSGGANPSVALTIQDNAFVNLKARTLDLNGSGAVTTLNLNGGSLTTGGFVKTAAASSTINLNGGKLIAGAASGDFLPNSPGLTVTIGIGGAKLDTAGFELFISSPIGSVAGDGGLAKSGAGGLTLFGAVNYTGVTTINEGSINFSGSAVHTIGAIRGTTAQIDFGATAIVGPSSGVSKLNTLSIAGSTGAWFSKLDLNNNPLIIEAADDADKVTKLATLTDQIASGRNGGLWNGNGITSATAAANPSQYTFLLLDNALTPDRTNFGGIPVDAESIIVVPVAFGDANFDGKVTGADYTLLANNFGGAGTWATGDFTGDGLVTGADYTLLANNFGLGVTPALAPAPSPVPEPASLAVIGAGSLLLIRRRKTKCH